ncbi:tyrosine-protein kinase family protein [Polyangium fumosum]|uniref:tyrosine-protein kinase family protein n=1 Tax=Polyangium fumosum TaxID=889272 RepID=UPI001479645A|nr:AAA family ATPase [Polyangium fumosum]
MVVFYSFKGGVGRTTALAAMAIQLARMGERVFVVDVDLDAPGAGTLLSPDEGGVTRGLVDYLLDAQLGDVDINDYVHRIRREKLVGDEGGEVIVMPAGSVDEHYLMKLARLDLEIRGTHHPLEHVLHAARAKLEPDWILIDSRAGLSPAAGLLLDGIAHLHVLFATSSAQSQLGIAQVIRSLGAERIRRDYEQANVIVVHAMLVDIADVEKLARPQFHAWLDEVLEAQYWVTKESDPEDSYWNTGDDGKQDAPGDAIEIPYRYRFAFFSSVDDVVLDLLEGPYKALGRRVLMQFAAAEAVDGSERG